MANITNEEIRGLQQFLEKTTIKEIMIKNVVTVFEDDELSLAEQKFVDHHINYLVVVDHNKKVAGLLSRKYLYKTLAPRKRISEEMDYDPHLIIDGDSFYEKETLDAFILRNIMNKNPLTLRPEDNLRKAVLEMAEKKVSCIPIVDASNKPVGILSHLEVVSYVANYLLFK